MGKSLKRYNESTGKWEPISPSHDSNSTNIDSNIVVTSACYTESGETTMLDETLCKVSDDIKQMKRNIAWLARHGGGGSGTGGGSSTSNDYYIAIDKWDTEDKVAYIAFENGEFDFQFQVIGAKESLEFSYTVLFDGNTIKEGGTTYGGKLNKITVKNIDTTMDNHSLYITATDVESLIPIVYSVTIKEQTLTISMASTILTVNAASTTASVPVNVKNSMRGSTMRLVFINTRTNAEYTTEDITNRFITEQSIKTKISKIIGVNTSPNSKYTISVYAEANITGSTGKIQSNTLNFTITVTSSETISIYISEELGDFEDYATGVTTDETLPSYALHEKVAFLFIPYKTGAKKIYYAVKIEKLNPNGELSDAKLLRGNYYDSGLTNEGYLSYTGNSFCTSGERIACYWLASDENYKGNCVITVKCWASNTEPVEKQAIFKLTESNDVYYSYQNPLRYSSGSSGRTLFARWSADLGIPGNSNSTGWTSTIGNYSSLIATGEDDVVTAITVMNIHNTNGRLSGFINDHLRLQSNSYGEIDLSKHTAEIRQWYYWEDGAEATISDEDGFTVSITFKADEMPVTDNVVFLWGETNDQDELVDGMRIDTDTAYWKVGGQLITCKLRKNALTTIDFVYNKAKRVAKMYVNGIIGGAVNEEINQDLNSTIWIGCAENGKKLSDVNIYNLSLFGTSLDDSKLVVNGYNTRFDQSVAGAKDIYKQWKYRNYFYSDKVLQEDGSSTVLSHLYENGTYLNPSYTDLVTDTPIPIVYITSIISGTWTRDSFLSSATKEVTKIKHTVSITYYDPSIENPDDRTVTISSAEVAIQGSSTTNYRSKNLEIYCTKKLDDNDTTKVQLFQPRADWFPESEFTLKADIMDSSHANNATLGRWINAHSKNIMDKNPAQSALENKVNRPRVLKEKGEVELVGDEKYERDENGDFIYHMEPTIKHTLEGFPVILLARFADEDKDTFLGIYSFNLGRYSYFNNGMKFLKSYRTTNNKSAPATVDQYEVRGIDEVLEYGNNEKLSLKGCYSYEFGADADDNTTEHPLWTQNDKSVLQFVGEFKYNGASPYEDVTTSDVIWDKLQYLFTYVAAYKAENQKQYRINTITENGEIKSQAWEEIENGKLSVEWETCLKHIDKNLACRNASAYFVVANAFGLIDSLGKNCTLRTWNGDDKDAANVKWYPCFYDMDTALGLNNVGAEAVAPEAYIDSYENEAYYTYKDSDGKEHTVQSKYLLPRDGNNNINVDYTCTPYSAALGIANTCYCTKNSPVSVYSLYKGKLWDLLRPDDTDVSKRLDGYISYESMWYNLRQSALTNADSFIVDMEGQMGECGEMVYNADYNFKYLAKYKKNGASVETYGDISMLHGRRIEYVRDWLQSRINFFDGVFKLPSSVNGNEIESPYTQNASITADGKTNMSPVWIVRTSCPFIFTCTHDSIVYRYYIPANTDTEIVLKVWSANGGKQVGINGGSVLTKLDRLADANFNRLSDSSNFSKLSEFNISGTKKLLSNPIVFSSAFIKTNDDGEKVSDLKSLNLSNTDFQSEGNNAFPVVLNRSGENTYTYNKISDINIGHSCVTQLVLPNVPLSSLVVNYSDITEFKLEYQPLLGNVSLEGCEKLQSVSLTNCDAMTEVSIPTCNSLKTVTLDNCSEIKTFVCTGQTALESIVINNLPKLEKIVLDECRNSGLTISITGQSSLKRISMRKLKTSNPIKLPSREYLSGMTTLLLCGSSNFGGFIYEGENSATTYNGQYVLDISSFNGITGVCANDPTNGIDADELQGMLNVSGVTTLKYLKVTNNKENPFKIIDRFSFGYNENITRVFGHISLGSEIFHGKKEFMIREKIDDPTFDENTGEFVSDEWATNITFSETDLHDMFHGTNCSLSDAYYALSCIDDNITSIANMFSECKSMSCPSGYTLNDNILSKCKNVTNITGLFNSCTELAGINVTSGFLRNFPTPKNLSSFINVLPLGFNIDSDDAFFPSGNTITALTGFEPTYTNACKVDMVLKNLTNLQMIDSSFNICQINMGEYDDGKTSTGLFKETLKLISLKKSFNCDIQGVIYDLFGGKLVDKEGNEEYYPRQIQEIDSCFVVKDEHEVYIGDSLFRGFASSLRTVKNLFNADPNSNLHNPRMNLRIDNDDCKYGNFPYLILSGCTALTEASFLMANLKPQADTEVRSVITLPSYISESTRIDMFGLAPNLESIKGFFCGISIPYSLVPDGFTKNKIKNMAELFSTGSYVKDGCLMGMIPYHMFYQASGNVIEDMSNIFAYNRCTGMTCYSGGTYKDDVNMWVETAEDGTLSWNKWLYDGSSDFIRMISGSSFYQDVKRANEGTLEDPCNYKSAGILLTDENGKARLTSEFPTEWADWEKVNPSSPFRIHFAILDMSEEPENKFVTNYLCPPDLFKYCNNVEKLNINGALQFTSKQVDNDFVGFKGRIPSYLFEPINRITTLNGVFSYCKAIFPYSWGRTESPQGITKYVYGEMYPIGLFSGLTNLVNITNLFAQTTIWGMSVINKGLFTENKKLEIIRGLWDGAKFIHYQGDNGADRVNGFNHFNGSPFEDLESLKDVSFVFNGCDVYAPCLMTSDFFKNSIGFMENAQQFMCNCKNTEGDAPAFWQNGNADGQKAYFEARQLKFDGKDYDAAANDPIISAFIG